MAPDDGTILHVAIRREWEEALTSGIYRRSTRGLGFDEVGFVHCARADQVAGVLARFYADEPEPLVVLTIDTTLIDAPLVDEPDVASGEAFPHLYGPVPVSAVLAVTPVTR